MPYNHFDHKDSMQKSLMACLGIQDSFVSFSGETIHISPEVQAAVLAAMKVDPDAEKALSQLEEQAWHSVLPPVTVVTTGPSGASASLAIHLPHQHEQCMLSWRVRLENGVYHQSEKIALHNLIKNSSRCINGEEHARYELPLHLHGMPMGYHEFELALHCQDQIVLTAQMPLILAPPRCYEPGCYEPGQEPGRHERERSADGKKIWGFSVQLYSINSSRNWGMGDFADLQALITSASRQGAGFLVLNPLHAGPVHEPSHCSPYSPVDRRRLNPLYIAAELEPEFEPSYVSPVLLAEARSGDWINYPAVSALKLQVLAKMFEKFLLLAEQDQRRQDFEDFMRAEGSDLQRYADWQARRPALAAGPFADNPEFYCYLQWLAEKQLESCQQQALGCGMALGLVRDLAVGSDRCGSEVQMSDGAFCTDASIGAPPDPLAPQGQNWGLPPLNPLVLRQRAYSHFINLLHSNMAHAGALRIDHVMSLMRLWWCPNHDSGNGAYVLYPDDDLFALLRLESHRQKCVVIGEDLGIVPDKVRRHLDSSRIYSNLLFYFEKTSAHEWRRPEHYRRHALAMLANHDVPPLAAWWNGEDLRIRRHLDLIPDDTELAAQLSNRQGEKYQILRMLESQWLLPANRFAHDHSTVPVDEPMDTALACALMRCIARSNTQLVSLQLEDLALMTSPVNIPGTSTQYRNWQRKLPADLHLTLDNEPMNTMLAGVRAERS